MIKLFSLAFCFLFPIFANAATCEATENENFLTFFFQFSGNKNFAVSRTVYPLKVTSQQYGVDMMGNNLSSTKRLTRTRQQDTLLPSLSTTLQLGNLIAKVHEQSAKSNVVQVYGENSEWGQTYHFSRKGKCWLLTEFREHTVSPQHWVEQQELAPRNHLVPHFYIKPDNPELRAMLTVLNHLAFVIESVNLTDMEDAQAELQTLCDNLEASVDYAIDDREKMAVQLREVLSLFNRGAKTEGSVMLSYISRTLWSRIN